jgi:hypothetical protein
MRVRRQGVRRPLHIVEISQVASDRLHGEVAFSDDQPDEPIPSSQPGSMNNVTLRSYD